MDRLDSETHDPGHDKAAILRRLSGLSLKFRVEPFIVVTVAEWREMPGAIRSRIDEVIHGPTIIVRSAWRSEDTGQGSAPGEFLSVSDVPTDDWAAITNAIDRVIASYGKAGQLFPEKDRVIVQSQLVDAHLAGVARPSEDDLYLLVDYDDLSGRTDRVTSGWSQRSVALWTRARQHFPWSAVLEGHLDIQRILGGGRWMWEFAIDRSGSLSVFQAKRVGATITGTENNADQQGALATAVARLPTATMLSDMADWNPAEMLGDRPRPFAVSLYRAMVTDDAWLKARTSLGYRSVEPSNLIVEIAAKPYVDVRRSCLSLLPARIDDELAVRLAADRLDVLRENGHLHDRVETALFFTCGDVADVPRTRALLSRGFSTSEVLSLERALNSLTCNLFDHELTITQQDKSRIGFLTNWFHESTPTGGDLPSRCNFVHEALAACRDYGVVPFARQARLAFVGQDLLARLVELNLIPRDWSDMWWRRLNSVATRVASALADLNDGRLSRDEFNKEYGHLRSRAYDIRCLPYRALQFPSSFIRPKDDVFDADLSHLDLDKISEALSRSGVRVETPEFFAFVRRTTLGREEAKFAFTRFLSLMLEHVAEVGNELGITRDELSFLAISDIAVDRGHPASDIAGAWRAAIERRKELWWACSKVRMPDLITKPADLFCVQDVYARPNFITDRVVVAEGIFLDPTQSVSPDLVRGRIVVTEAAEPGMDWIFACGIRGLVTRYGGRNSHMATRCAEFGIPAAIGCSANTIDRLAVGGQISLDCSTERVEVLPKEA